MIDMSKRLDILHLVEFISYVSCLFIRLTPLKRVRLMGFPDVYTKIELRGNSLKNCLVPHRYKCLRNSMVNNVIKRIGEGLNECT
jgi:site-specific DNA-cytosine methylase